jgi:xylan 1,4-beta-xylosidase
VTPVCVRRFWTAVRRGAVAGAAAVAGVVVLSAGQPSPSVPVLIRVDTSVKKGPLYPFWAWFGHDEPNYTYTPDGKKLLSELQALSPVPVFMRVHNLLTSGDGVPALKWGSTNVYSEDASGSPIYDWRLLDRIVDTYLSLKMKPFVQLGFMPEALSSAPPGTPYRHAWAPGKPSSIFTGWTYAPKDYRKWEALCYEVTRHLADKYGRDEVNGWWFEVWNEPDIGYWSGSVGPGAGAGDPTAAAKAQTRRDEYNRLYDLAVAGVHRALPTARIGGPEVTGGGQTMLRGFLEHTSTGTNYATGTTGTPLDLITFHAKGSPSFIENRVRMGVMNQLRNIDSSFLVIRDFPMYAHTPIVIGESDPEGCAACGATYYPQNAYRKGTMYATYTALQIARTYELADLRHVNLLGAVTWAFLFEDQPYFDGFRDLATHGIAQPVLNTFRMLGQMSGDRVEAQSSAGLGVEQIRDQGVRGAPDISPLAARSARSATVLIWNYHDDDLPAAAAPITLTVDGLPPGRATVTHDRIDDSHSNAYAAWLGMGSPQAPTPVQYAALEQASTLQELRPARQVTIGRDGRVTEIFDLPRKSVSFVKITW